MCLQAEAKNSRLIRNDAINFCVKEKAGNFACESRFFRSGEVRRCEGLVETPGAPNRSRGTEGEIIGAGRLV